MPAIHGFHHVAIHACDFDAALAFYCDGLGFQTKISCGERPGRAVMLDTGDGNYVEIFERAAAVSTEPAPLLHYALRTDDCSAMTERARAAGAEVTMEPKEVTIDSSVGPVPVKISFFRGPAGEIIELFESALL